MQYDIFYYTHNSHSWYLGEQKNSPFFFLSIHSWKGMKYYSAFQNKGIWSSTFNT